jgi:hypothetical protein
MADKKISLLNSANALTGLEVLPIVQSGITKKVSILDLTDNKKVFQYVSQNLNSNPANISTRINALPNFTISQDQILGFKDFVYSGANLQRIDVYELKNIGKGNYGVGGTPITESNFEFITSQAINFNTVSTNPSNQVIIIATLSGATISAFINAKTPPYVLQSSGDGLRIFDVTDGNVFIFNGVAGTYGSGNLQTVIGDFTLVPRENNVVLSVNGQTGAVVIPETVTEWEEVSGEIQNKLGKSVVVKNTSEDDQDYIFFVKKSNGSISVQVAANGTLETINNIKAARFDTDGGFGSVNGQVQLLIDALYAGFTSSKRINYPTDLSSTFTDRSLVDKGYADTKQTKLELSIKDGTEFFTDFDGVGGNNVVISGELATSSAGGGGGVSLGQIRDFKDALRMFNFTSSTSIQNLFGGSCLYNDLYFDFETLHLAINLSDGVNNYRLFLGLGSELSTTNHTNAIFFYYDKFGTGNVGVASDNYLCVCKIGVSISVVDSGVAVSTTTPRKLRFEKNNTDTEVKFLIDNVLVATITTNIPTTTMRKQIVSQKTLGTGSIENSFDYLYYKLSGKNRI